MYCRGYGITTQCNHQPIIEEDGCLPIIKMDFYKNIPICVKYRPRQICDVFYNQLKSDFYNPSVSEIDFIEQIVKKAYEMTPKHRKFTVLDGVAIFFSELLGIEIKMISGFVVRENGDFIFFYNSSNRARAYRERLIK